MAADLVKQSSGDYLASIGGNDLLVRKPRPGGSEWWEVRWRGEEFLHLATEADALARARLLAMALDKGEPLPPLLADKDLEAHARVERDAGVFYAGAVALLDPALITGEPTPEDVLGWLKTMLGGVKRLEKLREALFLHLGGADRFGTPDPTDLQLVNAVEELLDEPMVGEVRVVEVEARASANDSPVDDATPVGLTEAGAHALRAEAELNRMKGALAGADASAAQANMVARQASEKLELAQATVKRLDLQILALTERAERAEKSLAAVTSGGTAVPVKLAVELEVSIRRRE